MHRRTFLPILMLLTLLLLAACGEGETKVETIPFEDWQSYTIVRPDDSDSSTTDAAIRLRKAIEEAAGVELTLTTDWVKRGEEPPAGTLEILVGTTNRPESEQGLLYHDFTVTMVNNRLVITGGCGDAVTAAMDWFIENCVGESVMIPAEQYIYHAEYPLADVVIGGVKLSDYAIPNSSGDPNNASYSALRSWVADMTGTVPPSEGANQILFAVDETLNMEDISVGIEDGSLMLKVSDMGYSAETAFSLFREKLEAGESGKFESVAVYSLPMGNFSTAASDMVADWEAQADARRKEILNTPNMEIPAGSTVYYISPNGDDMNDGLSPEKAWKTIDRLKTATIPSGSYVCFERGGVWRGKFTASSGVTYTAYGKGDKPEIWGSPFNGAEIGSWEEVSENVWRYSEKIVDDVGMIVMNEGEAHGYKMILTYGEDTVIERVSGAEWKGYENLDEDYEFWHDLGGAVVENKDGGYIYMYCSEGNPAEVWDQIEFNTKVTIISCGNNADVTIDNLCIMYGGSHGIGAGTIKNLTVTNCEVGWIGGSIQFYRDGRVTRFGNGIEIYGGCTDFLIDNCYVYQCYDAGVTHQYSSGGTNNIIMDGVRYTNNLIENCIYSVEYFLGAPESAETTRYMTDILISDNIMIDAGYGFGAQRPDRTPDAHIKGWDHMNTLEGDFIIENNLFLRSKHMMIHSGVYEPEDTPTYRNNIFAQLKGGQFGRNGDTPTTLMMYNYANISREEYAANTFYLVNPEDDTDIGYEFKREVLPE